MKNNLFRTAFIAVMIFGFSASFAVAADYNLNFKEISGEGSATDPTAFLIDKIILDLDTAPFDGTIPVELEATPFTFDYSKVALVLGTTFS